MIPRSIAVPFFAEIALFAPICTIESVVGVKHQLRAALVLIMGKRAMNARKAAAR
jgi:hypothetical protein